MIEVEVFGAGLTPDAPTQAETEKLCALAAGSLGIRAGHVAIEFVDAERITVLNAEHRGRPKPTDVLSFPIDGAEPLAGGQGDQDVQEGARTPLTPPRELGDIVICPQHTADLREAIVHGMLHLLGMDHESDNGEMLALQDQLLDGASR
jgi:probable rRNA maturation factor